MLVYSRLQIAIGYVLEFIPNPQEGFQLWICKDNFSPSELASNSTLLSPDGHSKSSFKKIRKLRKFKHIELFFLQGNNLLQWVRFSQKGSSRQCPCVVLPDSQKMKLLAPKSYDHRAVLLSLSFCLFFQLFTHTYILCVHQSTVYTYMVNSFIYTVLIISFTLSFSPLPLWQTPSSQECLLFSRLFFMTYWV